MVAHYDNYDYPSYWSDREYEHLAEVEALKNFLKQIPEIGTLLEIGAGYGRLANTYLHRAHKVILTDPSLGLLKIARKAIKDKKVKYIQSKAETLISKVKKKSVSVIVCIRVAHHIQDLDKLFETTYSLLSQNGYFIFEFANKRHGKALITHFFQGDFTFPLDIFPKDISTSKSKKDQTLPFINYHPDIIKSKLKEKGFKILETRSVSNIRIPFIKKFISNETLIKIESYLQKPFSKFSIGPSIFILAKKKVK